MVACAPGLDPSLFEALTRGYPNVSTVTGKTYALLQQSTAALVTSGTATLETALLGVPQVVCYKGNWISYLIAKQIITLKYISLVNLIMDNEVVTELIQGDCNARNIKVELSKILEIEYRKKLIEKYHQLEEKLGGEGASSKVAKLIVHQIS